MNFKNALKRQIKKLPGIRKLVRKNQILERELEASRYASVQAGRQLVDYRLKLKAINKEKINVVFVCHRPAVWESLHSVYDALEADARYNVYIVAIPNKKELSQLWLNHEVYESEGAEKYWAAYGCINGYNYETKEWFDLRKLEPDYVFFQQPYNITRSEGYKSWNVAQYAKICYLNYFSPVSFGTLYDECTPTDFLRDISFYFTQNKRDHEFILDRYKRIGFQDTKCIMTGYPRYDILNMIKGDCNLWSDKDHKRFRLIWTPRWTTNEGNCHFFEFKDRLIDFCMENDIELAFRPHPQAFKEWASTGEFSLEEQNKLRSIFDLDDRLHLDESPNYLDLFYSSDCLLTDLSSIMYDYFLTAKPVVYSMGNSLNDVAELLQDGLYKVQDWGETKKILLDLILGKDSLLDTRKKVIEKAYYMNNNGAGNEIASILKNSNVQVG